MIKLFGLVIMSKREYDYITEDFIGCLSKRFRRLIDIIPRIKIKKGDKE